MANIRELFLLESISNLETLLSPYQSQVNAEKSNTDWNKPTNEKEIREAAEKISASLKNIISQEMGGAEKISSTADTPLFISKNDLIDPTLVDRSVSNEDANRIEAHLTTLKLRLKTRIDDRRWKSFLNYESQDTKFAKIEEWLEEFGFNTENSARVSIIDLSMLSHEALPYACGVIGRIKRHSWYGDQNVGLPAQMPDQRSCPAIDARWQHIPTGICCIPAGRK